MDLDRGALGGITAVRLDLGLYINKSRGERTFPGLAKAFWGIQPGPEVSDEAGRPVKWVFRTGHGLDVDEPFIPC